MLAVTRGSKEVTSLTYNLYLHMWRGLKHGTDSWFLVTRTVFFLMQNGSMQEIIKIREWTPHIGPITKVIPLKLFLDMVPSSSEDVTRAMRWQPKRLSQNYLRPSFSCWDEMAGTPFYMFWFRFIAELFSALSTVFLFGRAFVCFVLVLLFIILPFIRF